MSPSLFDLPSTPLRPGITVLEASAGTGKTFTLAGLFVRLLLEHGISHRNLLIVTYTEAATEELRGRLRDRLAEAIVAFGPDSTSTDPLFLALRERLGTLDPEFRHARATLQQALAGFDETPIRTIHGFCQRVLSDRAFESGSLFDVELLPSVRPLLEEVVADWWRQAFEAAGSAESGLVRAAGLSPGRLRRLLEETQRHPGIRLCADPGPLPFSDLRARIEAVFTEAAKLWQSGREEIRSNFGDGIAWGNLPYNRSAALAPMWVQLDACFQGTGGAGDFQVFKTLTPSAFQEKRNKRRPNDALPSHAFFERCAELVRLATHLYSAWILKFSQEAATALRALKQTRKIQSFDDLLTRLDSALEDTAGERLASRVADSFPAALIDEFQDTDPVQWRIFRRLFGRPHQRLFLIGDPKQAIYGFRGADVFTYLTAARSAAQSHTLGINWRSESGLVGAVNHLFQNRSTPFVVPEIEFHPVKAAGRADAQPLTERGQLHAPLQLWFLESEDPAPITKTQAEPLLAELTASEICRLLSADSGVRVQDRPLHPREIAVLVESHKQAECVAEALFRRSIPSVQQTQRGVFESDEAETLLTLLIGIADPTHPRHLRAALAGDILGLDGVSLLALQDEESAWAAWIARFQSWAERWNTAGFLPMFRELIRDCRVRSRWLALPDGERRLTNLLHLAELLHTVALERRLGVAAVCQHLAHRCADPGDAGDAELLRLERDDDAVQLVTIHRSKGLEYPVVFCPFFLKGAAFTSSNHPDDPKLVLCHDPLEAGRMIGDIGSPDRDRHETLATSERLAESMRLLYVALTRARNRCYVAWGHFKDCTTAPSWLFLPDSANAGPAAQDSVAALEAWGAERTAAGTRTALERLASTCEAIEISRPGSPDPTPWNPVREAESAAAPRRFTRVLTQDWRAASFTWLTAGHRSEAPDHDDTVTLPVAPQVVPVQRDPDDIHAFPRGARAGVCLHQLLEELDFAAPKSERLPLVQRLLRDHGIEARFESTVAEMIGRTLAAPLSTEDAGLNLASVARSSRLTELEFCFPLRRVTASDLRNLLVRYGSNLPGEFPKSLDRLEFNPVEGVMRGFMDLVFQAGGRWWLVDWKSNWLGADASDYTVDAVNAEMNQNLYPLQYLLYTVALDRWLALRIPTYDYDRDFGGVRYLFLRGIDPAHPGRGVFADRPPHALIRDLGALLFPAFPEVIP